MTIEVDFDVYKALTARRTDETVTYNDVLRTLLGVVQPASGLRRLFGLAAGKAVVQKPRSNETNDWIYKGIRFPAGTELRAKYKGQLHRARIERGGLMVNGRRFATPSDAARMVTGNNVNGWRFWQCRFPGETGWRRLDSLRQDS
ncbi:MAG: DUF2924 domain-containing protein [Alphaproteobacteria bacterium]|nr:DUF2924 domain-containing protein [Alphaproteobacteria bacterium]